MKIRKFVKNDLEQVLNLCSEVRNHHIEILDGYFTEQDDNLEQQGFLNSIDNSNIIALVAEHTDGIKGYLLAEKKFFPYLVDSNVAHISNFGVAKEKRGNGIGKMLMNAFYELCQQEGIDEIRLGVFNKNIGAYKFYEKYGFEPFEQRMKLKLKKK